MDRVESLNSFDQIKLLADPRRMAILRMIMDSPATLTQLGKALGRHPAWIQHHIKALISTGLVEIAEVRVTAGVTEKFYRAKAGAFLLHELILPQSDKPTIIFSGSHDLAIESLSGRLAPHVRMFTLPVGSLDGLVNLRQGLCHVAGAHLLDESGDYNTSYVHHLFPDRAMKMVTLAYRTQGLLLTQGNPKRIHSIKDLTRKSVTFINRNPGSGTRLWLDREIQRLGLSPKSILGYEESVRTHSEAALAVQLGKVDVALGIQAAAHQHDLDFIPLFEERYDLVIPEEQVRLVHPLLDTLQTAAFRKQLSSLTGYNTAHSGEQIQL
jgi:molybdopterin molybdotransferase/putative molybdopterin biosynthesis protein